MKKTMQLFVLLLMIVLAVSACKKDKPKKSTPIYPGGGGSGQVLDGEVTPIGDVGNQFGVLIGSEISGISNVSASITDVEGDVSTLSISAQVSNPTLAQIIEVLSERFPSQGSYENGVLTIDTKVKITDKGISHVIGDKELIMVKYDANPGDTYRITTNDDNGNNINHTRTVQTVSTDNDYYWESAGFYIKTISVESKNHNLPNLDKLVYYYNHRFGLVGVNASFQDGEDKKISVESWADNF
jgi:hypothetical protein